MEERPAIVRELRGKQNAAAFPHHDKSNLSSGRGGFFSKLSSAGQWRRPFVVFTWITTAFVFGGSIVYGVDEKDRNGNDHCYSDLYRWGRRKRDMFLGVEAPSHLNESSGRPGTIHEFKEAFSFIYKNLFDPDSLPPRKDI